VTLTRTVRAIAYSANGQTNAEADAVTVTFVPRLIHLSQQGGGTVTVNPSQPSYALGQSVTLTATPALYYAFLRWSDGVTTSNRTITIGTNNFYTAIFTNTIPLETQVVPQWQWSFGGSLNDDCRIVKQTTDGGYILGGYSYSGITGNKTTSNFGDQDYWVVKIDGSGNKVWENSFGGGGGDLLFTLEQTSDGGYILGGTSVSSVSGNKTSASYGGLDYWVVKIDGNGNKVWENSFGGSGYEAVYSLQQTSDGGYILGGYSASGVSGNKTSASYGDDDYWVVKIDGSGNKMWENSFGGSGYEEVYSLQQTSDGGYILGAL